MVAQLIRIVSRWLAATAVGVFIPYSASALGSFEPVGFIFVATTLVLGPILLARVAPERGAWLATAMLVPAPLALWAVNWSAFQQFRPIPSCGLGHIAVWWFGVPLFAGLGAPVVALLWHFRPSFTRFARVGRIATLIGAILLVAFSAHRASVAPGTVIPGWLLQEAHRVQLEFPAHDCGRVADASGLVVRRSCDDERVLEVAPNSEFAHDKTLEFQVTADADFKLVVYSLANASVLEFAPPSGPSPRHEVIDETRDGLGRVPAHQFIRRFSPPQATIYLLFFSVISVLLAARTAPTPEAFWRRLAGRPSTDLRDGPQETHRCASMDVAVVVVAALPLLAGLMV